MHHDHRSSYGPPDRQFRARELALRLMPLLPRLVLSVASFLIAATVFNVLVLDDMSASVGKLAGDEAGYYFGVARNAVLGYGVSFDRVDATNGLNPLFTLLLVATYWAFLPAGVPVESCYRIGVGITFLALIAAAWLFAKVFEVLLEEKTSEEDSPETIRILGRSALFMFLGVYAFKQVHGVDYLPAILTLLAYVWHILRHGAPAPEWRSSVVSGALLGLTVLARADSLCFVGSTYVVLALMTGGARASWKPLLTALAATTAIVLPYFLAGELGFGSWLPVSALLVTSFPAVDISTSLAVLAKKLSLFDQLSFSISFILSLYFIVQASVYPASRARFPADRPATVLLILSAYVAARVVWMALFTRVDALSGYLAGSSSYNAFAIAYLWMDRRGARHLPRWTQWVSASMVTVGLLGLVVGTLMWRRSVEVNVSEASPLAFAKVVRHCTFPSDLIYGEGFGMAGFLSDRRWMDGKGVVGTMEHFRLLTRGERHELHQYLDRQGVTHIVTADWNDAALGSIVYQQRLGDRRDQVVYLVRLTPGWVGEKESPHDTNLRNRKTRLRTVMVQNK